MDGYAYKTFLIDFLKFNFKINVVFFLKGFGVVVFRAGFFFLGGGGWV